MLLLALLLALTLFLPASAESTPQDSPTSDPRFAPIVGDLGATPIDFDTAWRGGQGANPSAATAATLNLARLGKSFWKNQLPHELDQPALRNQHLAHNLDVGRHEILKGLVANAVLTANRQLAAARLSPLTRVQTVNAGSTGNCLRDIDLTVHAGDGMREHYFMLALEQAAQAVGLKEAKYDPKAGLSIPELEVEFHRGSTDPPPLHTASDLQEFTLKYERMVEAQVRNPEAYIGGGAVTEVQGRQTQTFKPGTTYVQTFDVGPNGGVAYRGDKAVTPREAQALLGTPLKEQYRNGERAMNIYSGYREAIGHGTHADADLSKGPLKYGSRALDQLCEIQGRKPYAQLTPEERLEVVASVFEPGALEDPARRKLVEKMTKSLDDLPATLAEAKNLGVKAEGETRARLGRESAMVKVFLRQATATTVSHLAREMLNPPYDPRFVDEMIRTQKWDKLNESQRRALATRLDANYQKAVSAMSMTDLLAVTWTLHTMDLPENDPRGLRPGRFALNQLLESETNPRVRKVLELATEHGRQHVIAECSTDPKARVAARNEMSRLRTQLFAEAAGKPSPGQTLIEKAIAQGPHDYLKAVKSGSRPSWDAEPAETRARITELLARMKADDESYAARLKTAAAVDAAQPSQTHGYLKARLKEELVSLATLADAITLVELYQQDASNRDMAAAVGFMVISRAHWSIGFLRAAATTGIEDEAAWKALGKEAFFWTAAHYLPHVAGTLKLAFDIELGLVKITLTPTFNDLDASLVDALYTGEAGRSVDRPSNWASRYREGVDALLSNAYIIRTPDPKTNKTAIDINRPQLFEDTFKRWTGIAHDEPRRLEHQSNILIKAFDAYYMVRTAQLESLEPTWLVNGTFKTQPLPEEGRVRETYNRFASLVRHKCQQEAQKVMADSAARTSFRYSDTDDRILSGLTERYAHDLLLGMEHLLQTETAERALARRHIERSAACADTEVLASALAASLSPPDGSLPTFELRVGIEHPSLETTFDGTEPLPLTCQLQLRGQRPANMPDVVMEISPGPVKNLTDSSRAPRAGDLVKGPVTVRALAGSTEIATATVDLTVRLGVGKPTLKILPVKPYRPPANVSLPLEVKNPPKKASYKWDFGDGKKESFTWAGATHLYEKAGDYTISVQLFDEAVTPPKLVAQAKTNLKVAFPNLLPDLQRCNSVDIGWTAEVEKPDGIIKNLVSGISNHAYGTSDKVMKDAPLKWSGTSFETTWKRVSDHPNGTIDTCEIRGTVSEDGRSVTSLTMKWTSQSKNGNYQARRELEVVDLPTRFDGEPGAPRPNIGYMLSGDKAQAKVKKITSEDKLFDNGKLYQDRSAKRIEFKPQALHHISVSFNLLDPYP